METNLEKLKSVFADEKFTQEIFAYEEPQEVQKALEDKGISLSTDEITQLGNLLAKYQSGELSEEALKKAADGELSDEELGNVAGGGLLTLIILLCVGAATIGGIAGMVGGGISINRDTRGRW
ncbi:hypothetical protein V6615_00850 [Oscillospiraceae bacterium PP1C4]